MTADPSKPELSTTGCLLRIGVALFAVVVVLGSAAAGYFLWDQQKHRKALAAEVQAIRDAGEPLDGSDLNKFYRLPEGEADITTEWVAALAPFSGNERLASSGKKLKPFLKLNERGQEPPHRPDPWPQLAEAEEQLAPYREALAKVAEVSRKRGGVRYPIDMTSGWNTQLPQTNACRSAGLALQLQGLCHYERGAMSRVADDVITLIQLAQTLRFEPLLISQVIRISTLHLAKDLTIFVAADPEFPENELQRIQDSLTSVEFDTIQLPMFLGERAGGYAFYSQPYEATPDDARPLKAGAILLQSRPGDATSFLYWNARGIEVARLPFREAVAAAREMEQEQDKAFTAEDRLPEFMQNQVSRFDLFSPLRRLDWLGRATTENRALQTLCAVERFRRQHDRLPESLTELVPEYLTSVPLDPYTDQPLKFSLSEFGQYTIYGVGINGKDDLGRNVATWPPSDNGVDSFYRLPMLEPPPFPGEPGPPGEPMPPPPISHETK